MRCLCTYWARGPVVDINLYISAVGEYKGAITSLQLVYSSTLTLSTYLTAFITIYFYFSSEPSVIFHDCPSFDGKVSEGELFQSSACSSEPSLSR